MKIIDRITHKQYCKKCSKAVSSLDQDGLCVDCAEKEAKHAAAVAEYFEKKKIAQDGTSTVSDNSEKKLTTLALAEKYKKEWEQKGEKRSYEQYSHYMRLLGKRVPGFNPSSHVPNGTTRLFCETTTEIKEPRPKTTYYQKAPSNSNIDRMSGSEFEDYCVVLLKKRGYKDVKKTPASGDQGADIICSWDGIKLAIQCKCYSQPVGNSAIQEAAAGKVYYDCHVAIVMTNNTFTRSATTLAEKLGVILWNGATVKQMVNRK